MSDPPYNQMNDDINIEVDADTDADSDGSSMDNKEDVNVNVHTLREEGQKYMISSLRPRRHHH